MRTDHMDYIIIKHYIADLDPDYREINMSKLEDLLCKMKLYAKESGKQLLYAVMSENDYGFPVRQDTFADIEYTGEISDEEKQRYTQFLKSLSYNEEYSARNDRMKLHCMLKLIRFRKITDELLPI